MKPTSLLLFILLFLSPYHAAAEQNVSLPEKKNLSADKNKWQRINEIDKEQERIFNQYRKDKEDLAKEYQNALENIEQAGGDDMIRKKVQLEKEYKKNKDRLLDIYRRENWRLKKEEDAIKGRKTVVTSEIQIRQRLENSPVLESTDGVKK